MSDRAERGLDFAGAAAKVFAGWHLDLKVDRREYGESRYLTAVWLRSRFVVLVWRPSQGAGRSCR